MSVSPATTVPPGLTDFTTTIVEMSLVIVLLVHWLVVHPGPVQSAWSVTTPAWSEASA